jgi:type IV fimbrial biogenesis protein FimT
MGRKNQKGFTLIEIIVVVVIIGVLSVIAIPNYLRWQPNMKLKGAARDLYSVMQKAKLIAVNTNADTAIIFDTANNKYYLCDDPGVDGTWGGTTDNNILTATDFSAYKFGIGYGHGIITGANDIDLTAFPDDDVSYNDATYGSNVVAFNPQGMGNGGYVYLENESDTVYAVGTQPSGVIRLRSWNGGGWQ